MAYGIKGTYGLQSSGGGGTSIPDWLSLPNGTEGDVTAVNVDGELCIAERGPVIWELRSPSAPAQAYAASNVMPEGAIVYPSIYAGGTGMETSFQAINDGSLWFENTGAARVFAWQPRNNSGRTATFVRILLPNALASASSARVSVGTGGGGYDAASWSTPTAPLAMLASGDQGEFELGMMLVEIPLPAPVANGSRIVVRIEAGAGVAWTGISSANSVADNLGYAAEQQMSTAGTTMTGGWSSAGLNIGMNLGGIQWGTEGDPIVRVLCASDSVGAGVPPIADGNSNTRVSWISGVNVAEAANGQRFSLFGYGEGGYTADQFIARIQHLIDVAPATLQAMCEVVAIQYPTWNQYPGSSGDSDARELQFTTLRSALLPLGIRCIPYIVTPPGLDRQSAGNLTAFTRAKAFAAANNGVDMSDLCEAAGDVTNIAPAKSADNVHLDSNDGPAHGTASAPRWASALQSLNMIPGA